MCFISMRKLVYLSMIGISAMFLPLRSGYPHADRDLYDKPFHTRIAPKDGTIVEFIPKKISEIPAYGRKTGIYNSIAMNKCIPSNSLFRLR